MKQIMCFLMVVLLMVFSAVTVNAEGNVYELEDFSLEIPYEYGVFTRDIDDDDPNLDEYGLDKEELLKIYKDGNIYLNAFSDNWEEEIVVTIADNSLHDFYSIGDSTLEAFMSEMEEVYQINGVNITGHEFYKHPQAKFIKIYFTDISSGLVDGIQYYTINDNRAINITLRNYSFESISSEQEGRIKGIVDSVEFNNPPVITEPAEETKSFLYTDSEANVTFRVPANWVQKPLSKPRDYIDAKFICNADNGLNILYGSTDVWEKTPYEEKKGYSRSDVNNSMFALTDIAHMAGCITDDVKRVTYNGVEYFQAEFNVTSEENGLKYDLGITMTCLIRYENGWMYQYQFSSDSNNNRFDDFVELINSVSYPQVDLPIEGAYAERENTFSWGWIIVIGLVGAVVVLVVVLAKSRNKHRTPKIELMDSERIVADYDDIILNQKRDSNCRFCDRCGTKMPLDSAFCHVCGLKITKEE